MEGGLLTGVFPWGKKGGGSTDEGGLFHHLLTLGEQGGTLFKHIENLQKDSFFSTYDSPIDFIRPKIL
jgi:hypothetical protein